MPFFVASLLLFFTTYWLIYFIIIFVVKIYEQFVYLPVDLN